MASLSEALSSNAWVENWQAGAMVTRAEGEVGISIGGEEVGDCSEADAAAVLEQHGVATESGWCSVEESIASGHTWSKGSPYWQANGVQEPVS